MEECNGKKTRRWPEKKIIYSGDKIVSYSCSVDIKRQSNKQEQMSDNVNWKFMGNEIFLRYGEIKIKTKYKFFYAMYLIKI